MTRPNICFRQDDIDLATNNGSVNSIELPIHCFDVIIARLNKRPLPKCPPSIPNECFPLFVTLYKGNFRHLRGCIGTFNRNLPLHEGLNEYAQISAFRDTRFDPVTLHEVPLLQCRVSLLVCFEPADDYRDWVVGLHGIRIEFRQHHRPLNAVFLPEVAFDNGWDHVETVNHLMWKGGFKGDITETDRLSVLVERFQSDRSSVTYEEYMAYKQKQLEEDSEFGDGGGQSNGIVNGFMHSNP
uniref:AMMECR1 domain-containing protein n=1 Tax=Globodera pallida TaxID=36090 RepID=A0A183CHQ9_GLOPA